RLLTPAASLRRETNRQACFISPSAERSIVRCFDTRGKTRAGFRGGKLAARIGISHLTLADVLSASRQPKVRIYSRQPMAKTKVKLRAFLDAEAKRSVGTNGIRPM